MIAKRLLAAALGASLVLPWMGGLSPASAQAETAVVTVDAKSRGFEFSQGLYGTNHRFFGDACGTWDSAEGKVYDTWNALYGASGLHAIRYPGGTCANYFWWKDSVGPLENRPNEVNSHRQNVGEVAAFGLDEFMTWAEENNQKVTYVYNVSNGNARDAAELIYYLNGSTDSSDEQARAWAERRAANGHAAPYHITCFELGNELHFQSSAFSVGRGAGADRGKTKAEMYATGAKLTFMQTPVGVYGDYSTAAAQSDGKANQVKLLTYGPADSDRIHVYTGTANVSWAGADFVADGEEWTRVTAEEMEHCGPEDKVFWVENRQYIHFGDGVHGAIPPEGVGIAATYTCWHDGVAQYVEAMKAAAKACGTEIRIYSCIDSAEFVTAAKDMDYDGLAIHPYLVGVGCGVSPVGNWTADLTEFHNNSMLAFDLSTAYLDRKQALLDANAGVNQKQRDCIVTEFTNHSASGLYYGSMSNTVLTMSQLFDLFQRNFRFALRHSTVDDFFGGGTSAMALYDSGPADGNIQTGEFIAEPAAHAYRLLDDMTGKYHLSASIQNVPRLFVNPETAVKADDSIQTDGNCDLVKCLASVNEAGEIFLILLNKSIDTPFRVEINVPGYVIGTADTEVLWSEDVLAVNQRGAEETVKLVSDTLEVNGESFQYTLPYCSMVGFKLNAKK